MKSISFVAYKQAMMSSRLFPIVFILFQAITLLAQSEQDFHPPVKIPMYLSGNFGELRPDHFHSGIDIKTQGRTGHKVYAIDEGYVSRIKVQANGYGFSLYLAHPGGLTSVYGHLDRYRDDIAAYVKDIQYRRRSHQVDIYPEEGLFRVEKGEFIAYSGNSGSSFGPHVHFEIRNSANQHPTNALQYGFDIADNTPPRFHSMSLVPIGLASAVNGENQQAFFDLVKDQGRYTVPWGTSLKAFGTLGIAVEVFDYLDGSHNRCGVYTLEAFVGEERVYSHKMEEFAFSESRYINAHMDYASFVHREKKMHRLFRLPNDELRIYKDLKDGGHLRAEAGQSYPVRIVATDVAGNSAELHFTITGQMEELIPEVTGDEIPMNYQQENVFERDDLRLTIPENSLYGNLQFRYSSDEADKDMFAAVHHLHNAGIPLHRTAQLAIRVPEDAELPASKYLIMHWDEQDEEWVPEGGEYRQGWVQTGVRQLGSYTLAIDTVAPVIKPVKGSEVHDQSGRKSLNFTVSDELSGIDSYEGYMDNRWVLFEYDPKNDLLTYTFDEERLSRDIEHELELYVKDAVGNVSLYHRVLRW